MAQQITENVFAYQNVNPLMFVKWILSASKYIVCNLADHFYIFMLLSYLVIDGLSSRITYPGKSPAFSHLVEKEIH